MAMCVSARCNGGMEKENIPDASWGCQHKQRHIQVSVTMTKGYYW